MKTRIQYLDSLKGFAIFLVVFAHCIPLQFINPRGGNEFASLPMKINDFIYLFHMPLFMFVSGYLTGKSLFNISTLRDWGQFLKKRFQSLLIPYFVAGVVLYFFKGMLFVYWYLLVLFEFILICSIVRLGVTKFCNSRQDLISMCLFVLMAITLVCVFPQIRPFHKAPFLDIEHFSLFPYYVLGLFSFRVSYEQKVLDKEWALFVFAVFTLLLYMGMTRGNFNEVGNAILQLSFVSSLILLIVCVFYRLPQDTRVLRCLQRLGNFSLEIYILHFFFLFNNPIRWGLVAKIFESHMGGGNSVAYPNGDRIGRNCVCPVVL